MDCEDDNRDIKRKLLECYKYAISTRPKMKAIQKIKWDDKLIELDKKYCAIIIDNLEFFWC